MPMDVYEDEQTRLGKFAGKVLAGKYLLTERVGEGAEGVIYAGNLRYDDTRKFAIKVGYSAANLEVAKDGYPTDPILREHRILREVTGPFSPRVIDSGLTKAGYAFAVRELLPGVTLARLMKRNTQPAFANCVQVAIALSQALQSIHNQGFVHRDIKPGNILIASGLDDDITLRLIDFAAAAKVGAEIDTEEAIASGTPAYMAPERARGEAGGPGADLYSLAAILYELFAAEPVLGPDSWNMQAAHHYLLGEDTIPAQPLRTLRADVPPEVGQAIHQLLDRDPGARQVELSHLESLLRTYLRRDQLDQGWYRVQNETTALLPNEQDATWSSKLWKWLTLQA